MPGFWALHFGTSFFKPIFRISQGDFKERPVTFVLSKLKPTHNSDKTMKNPVLIPPLCGIVALMLLPACDSGSRSLSQPKALLTAPADVSAMEVQSTAVKNFEPTTPEPDNLAKSKKTAIHHLIVAYLGEITASAKYAAYAQKAQEEGYDNITLLFRATSVAEKIHAGSHQSALVELGASIPDLNPHITVRSTIENLKDAIAGESYEIASLYPELMSGVPTGSDQLARISLNFTFKVEQRQLIYYEKALAALLHNKTDALPNRYYVCSTCGYTYESVVPKNCDISMTNGERFLEFNAR